MYWQKFIVLVPQTKQNNMNQSPSGSANSSTPAITTIPNWSGRAAGEVDPTDREIVAYRLGKEDGKNEKLEAAMRQLFQTNLELCCYYSSKFYDYLTKEKKIDCELATIKANSLSDFEALFVIKFEDYKSKDLRRDLLKIANDYRKSLKIKDVYLEIRTMGATGKVDKNQIFNDGYFMHHKKD